MVTPIQSAVGRLEQAGGRREQVGRWRRRVSQPEEPAVGGRLDDSCGGGQVAPRHGDEEETPVKARTSDDEDRRQNRSEQRRSYG
jgi:hypothetical protein